MATILSAEKLNASYGATQVLFGVSFAVEERGITTILGANGAGKTTLLRAICGMVQTQGQINFLGERIESKATEDIVRMGIGHVPDGRGTFVNLTVEENLRLGAYTRRDKVEMNRIFSGCIVIFHASKNGKVSRPAPFPAGNSKCLPLAAR